MTTSSLLEQLERAENRAGWLQAELESEKAESRRLRVRLEQELRARGLEWEGGTHDTYQHAEDGRVCVWLTTPRSGMGYWFVPWDAGGEGVECDRKHASPGDQSLGAELEDLRGRLERLCEAAEGLGWHIDGRRVALVSARHVRDALELSRGTWQR